MMRGIPMIKKLLMRIRWACSEKCHNDNVFHDPNRAPTPTAVYVNGTPLQIARGQKQKPREGC